jgi:hypothetical protein
MKKMLLLCLIGLLAASAQAQTESYDLATYTPPAGWKKAVQENVCTSYTFTHSQTGGYCQIFVLRSMPSRGGITEDFENEWRNLIVNQYHPAAAPKINGPSLKDGWQVKAGGASFAFHNGQSLAMLTTLTGYGKTVSIVAVTNSEDYLPAIDSFLASVKLKKPDAPLSGIAADAGAGSSIVGTWGKKAGVHQTYGDPVSYGQAGYSKDQYTFQAGGTYSFVSKTFRSASSEILLVRESGTYQIRGNTLTVTPQKSVIEAWSKKDGTDRFGSRISTRERPLETTTYQFTRHYFSGLQEWNLVLQANAPTQRDGPFSGNTTFANAWYYAPISSTNPAIDAPGGPQL